jgi:hypothetical protein
MLLKLGGFWLLPPRDFPHQLRVTLWITTAFHLDTRLESPTLQHRPFSNKPLLPNGISALLGVATIIGDRYYAALARCVVVRFSPTMKDGFTVDIV